MILILAHRCPSRDSIWPGYVLVSGVGVALCACSWDEMCKYLHTLLGGSVCIDNPRTYSVMLPYLIRMMQLMVPYDGPLHLIVLGHWWLWRLFIQHVASSPRRNVTSSGFLRLS